MADYLLKVDHVSKEYEGTARLFQKASPTVRAVSDVSFEIRKGETFGVVGESGCGKSTLGKCIVRLHPITKGDIWYNDNGTPKDITKLSSEESFRMRRKVQMVFQDPYASLNPSHNILEAFDEPMRVHGLGSKEERREIIAEKLRKVNLQPDYMYRFPGEFSGGQRQRICVAKALALQPELIVCDEPVSALDVSIQAQLLNLMRELQAEYGLTYMFIAHDLSVVQYMSDRIAVMYLGKVVEILDGETIHTECRHPYTEALLSAVPIPVFGKRTDRIVLQGDVPSPINPPSGCKFHPRCSKCMGICKEVEPELKEIGPNHQVACHLYD